MREITLSLRVNGRAEGAMQGDRGCALLGAFILSSYMGPYHSRVHGQDHHPGQNRIQVKGRACVRLGEGSISTQYTLMTLMQPCAL